MYVTSYGDGANNVTWSIVGNESEDTTISESGVLSVAADEESDYITINEPQCIIFMGHDLCLFAPGIKYNEKELLLAIHNLLLCHGHAVSIIRRNIKNSTRGFAPCSRPLVPSTNNQLLYKKCYELHGYTWKHNM